MRPFLVVLALAGMITAAQAQTDDRYPSWSNRMQGHQAQREWRWPQKRSLVRKSHHPRYMGSVVGGRPSACPPRAWCGCYLSHLLGMPRRALWLAANWAGVGRSAHGPGVGVIVVWRHHVGIITGKTAQGWVVKSGNDGHRVRERPRSLARAIAYRVMG